MNKDHPIFTAKNECQDCSRCVRNCPVKAIRIENSSAMVIADRCIACGQCVEVCPVHAKRVRDDLGRVKALLDSDRRVVVSLAPSYLSEFGENSAGRLIHALKQLGFHGVSETALGAQEISATVSHELQEGTPRILLSSACPVVVDLVYKYLPSHAERVTNLASPALAHCRLLRREMGNDIAVVFIGPCIAKKLEADRYPDLMNAAISFADLRHWFEEEKIRLPLMSPDDSDVFVPAQAEEGALYPVDGGMIAGIKANCAVHDAGFMAFSGVDNVQKALEELDDVVLKRPLFLELLGCEGGCINGPQAHEQTATVLKRHRILEHTPYPERAFPRAPSVDAVLDRRVDPVHEEQFSEKAIHDALAQVGKLRPEDELNCSGCGYLSCRDFACALLAAKAEPTMCVSYMRKLAQKKANALIQTMPSGVVIVSGELSVVECNRRFAEILGDDVADIYDAAPGMAGASLKRIAPFLVKFFRNILDQEDTCFDRDLKRNGRVYHVSIFPIENGRIIGGILQDITAPAVQRERVVHKAQEVIRRQAETVQKIAYLLGENAAESQVSLNAIIESFSQGQLDEGDAANGR